MRASVSVCGGENGSKKEHKESGNKLSVELEQISKKYGEEGLPDDTISINFTGSSGQSAAAFMTRGVTMTIIGDSNDGTGKGLCGGKVVVRPDPRNLNKGFRAQDNVITGSPPPPPPSPTVPRPKKFLVRRRGVAFGFGIKFGGGSGGSGGGGNGRWLLGVLCDF